MTSEKKFVLQQVLSDDRLRPYIKGKFDALQAVSEANGKKALFKKMGKGKRKAPWKGGVRRGEGARRERRISHQK